ncbi:type II toxin-antitoxin system RelE/ParE family toxin [Allomuricauda sp. AC10]|uniref:type II toxin-antitoxin system RelE/ParE family toxin n=1 Tax=Flavobacteriaceae TaxID=49546 RepID=UPI002349AF68|nr:hypothetical protein [Muricauda sp. AC10]
MAYKVHISKEAEIELHVAECFFTAKNLSKEFLADFSRQLQFLKTTPYSFQIKYRGIRIICFETFNYSIHFLIRNNEIIILRILNQRQNF